MKQLCLPSLLLCFSFSLHAQLQIDEKQDSTRKQDRSRYVTLLPLVAAKWVRVDGNMKNEMFILGLKAGQGIHINKFNTGVDISFDIVNHFRAKNIYRTYLQVYGEYQYFHYKRLILNAGILPYLLRIQYTPEADGYRFFNDPVDGKQRVHMVPGGRIYTTADIRIGKYSHAIVGIFTGKKFTNKVGRVPDPEPKVSLMVDFRTAFPKFLMNKKPRYKNYY